MSPRTLCVVGATVLALASILPAKPVVTMDRADGGFGFAHVPPPAVDDAGTKATIAIVDGRRDAQSADPAVLVDGRVPSGSDDPRANFFFAPGTDGGRLRLSFEAPLAVGSVATYSWHRTTRAPQVYSLYGATGEGRKFNAEPAREIDPVGAGWTLIAEVDTRPGGQGGGAHGVLVAADRGGTLGSYRYLLFDLHRTEDRDPFGNTFLSEIDVTDAKTAAPERLKMLEKIVKTFTTKDGKYIFTIDASKAPELMEWAEKDLIPTVEEWYPKMIAMMPSEGFTAADKVHMEFKDDMGGIPAYASGNRLSFSVPFFRSQLQGEAKGCVIHELVHTIQDYARARRTNRNPSPTPGWITEGTADYVRWFLFEPEKKGAEITPRNIGGARYDASYRTSANFLDWVVRNHDQDLLAKLNSAAREGRYHEKLWKEWSGKSLEQLGALWLQEHRERLGIGR